MRNPSQAPGDRWGPSGHREDVRREERQQFIAGFPKHCDSIDLLLKTISARGPKGSAEPLRQTAHQLAGAAGAVGFPNVSDRASELEMLAAQADKGFSLDVARGMLEALRETFAREISSPPSWASAAAVDSDAGARILVVDESEDQRQVVTDYLQLAGYDPVTLASGDSVVEAARQHQPRAILLEADLPGMDGYSVCRLLKADPELAHIPVIFVTVRSSLDDKLAGLTLGADDYLIKPVDPRELLQRIDMLLRRPRTTPR
jgi:CheY-like chemotaxis protein